MSTDQQPPRLTARKVCELLAMHSVSRNMACVYPDNFNQDDVFKHADEQSKKLIRYFEAHRKHLLEALVEEYPEAVHVI